MLKPSLLNRLKDFRKHHVKLIDSAAVANVNYEHHLYTIEGLGGNVDESILCFDLELFNSLYLVDDDTCVPCLLLCI